MRQYTNAKRITAWIAMVAVVFVMLFSVMFISQHVDHECTGADCPVCVVLEQCWNNIKNVGAIAVAIIAAFFLCLSIQKSIQYVILVYSNDSLISKKVRLNN